MWPAFCCLTHHTDDGCVCVCVCVCVVITWPGPLDLNIAGLLVPLCELSPVFGPFGGNPTFEIPQSSGALGRGLAQSTLVQQLLFQRKRNQSGLFFPPLSQKSALMDLWWTICFCQGFLVWSLMCVTLLLLTFNDFISLISVVFGFSLLPPDCATSDLLPGKHFKLYLMRKTSLEWYILTYKMLNINIFI